MTLTYNLVIDRNKVHLLNISPDAERATHSYKRLLYLASSFRAQEPSVKVEAGRPALLLPNSPYGLCGLKATLKKLKKTRSFVDCLRTVHR